MKVVLLSALACFSLNCIAEAATLDAAVQAAVVARANRSVAAAAPHASSNAAAAPTPLAALASAAPAAPERAHASPKIADVFKGVTYAQPKCYGREYSRAELAKHPKQTVEQIKAKLIRYSADPAAESAGLKIEVRLAKEEGMNYHAEFSCFENENKVLCAIDCDGGSVTIGEFDQKSMTLKSNGFTVKGGCGEDENEVTKFIKATKSGDDIFKLQALPPAFCTDASAAYDPVGEKK